MRRIARHLVTLCALASLLLCVAACVLWARSYWVIDGLHHAAGGFNADGSATIRRLAVVSSWGTLGAYRWGQHVPPAALNHPDVVLSRVTRNATRWISGGTPHPGYARAPSGGSFETWGWAGFGFAVPTAMETPPNYVTAGAFHLAVPHWSVALLAAVLPGVAAARVVRRRRRARVGHCPACGYDLRASPDRCPECGTLASPDSNAK